MNGPIIALAAGGTGGHLFPAKALASALLTRGPRPVLVTDARGEAFEIAGHDLPVHRIAAKSPSGGWLRRLTGGGALALGVFQARVLLARLAPAAVVGFGGFASVPTVGGRPLARFAGCPARTKRGAGPGQSIVGALRHHHRHLVRRNRRRARRRPGQNAGHRQPGARRDRHSAR